MRRLIFIIFCLILFVSCGQKGMFEGKVKYKITYTSSSDKISIRQLKEMYGDTCDYIYKNGDIEWKIKNSNYCNKILYVKKKNILYYFLNKPDSVMQVDCSDRDEDIVSYKIIKNKETILGYQCDVLIIDTKPKDTLLLGLVRKKYYYFTKKINIDSTFFLNYKYNSQDFVAKKTGGLILKIVDCFEMFSITYEAIEIKMDNNIFNDTELNNSIKKE